MKEELPQSEKERIPLTFEEFRRPENITADGEITFPRHNNFFMHFLDDKRNLYRKKKALLKLREVRPDLEKELVEAISKAEQKDQTRDRYISKLEPQLYEAYLIMHEYVADDEELFR